jgi:Flp pilus assembly protein CpaB
MKPKTMILMIVAVGCGLGASYMTSRLLAERGSAPEEQEKTMVLVARKNLETGMTVKNPQDMFLEKVYIKGEEPKSAILKFEDVKGKVLKHGLREGDWVSMADLLSDKESALQYLLPKDHFAIGLRVNIESIAGGFASLPLSRVDVYSTVRRADDKGSFCKLLLQNVLVLAADQSMDRNDKSQAMPATVVTVALKREDILRVNLAKEFGPLSLVLRGFNDNQKVDSLKATFEDVVNGAGKNTDVDETAESPTVPKVAVQPPMPPTQPVAPPPPPEPKTHTYVVTLINGDRQEQVEFTLDEQNEVLSSRLLQRSEPPRPEQPAANPPAAPKAAPDQGAANP